MPQLVAVDTGGTFTDLVAYGTDDRRLAFAKSLTTYDDLIAGVRDCVGKAGTDLAAASFFKHGTTLVINTLLERTGGPAALVTTRGFRDVLEIGRGNRPDTFDLFYRRHPQLIPRRLRFELDERIDGQGRVLRAPADAEIVAIADRIRASGVAAVAVSLLNAYVAPAHEQDVAARLRSLLPDLFVTCGSDLSREWYEYERTATAAANAYVGPRIVGYLHRLDGELRGQRFRGQAFMMGSNGGALAIERAAAQPVMLVESGPVGGCIGAAAYAEALGLRNVIAFDMGGTTAKSALVRDGSFDVKPVYYVGGYERGFPIRGAVLDIVEVGAGGGSIAALDRQGRLSVGPRSAGSTPGPVAYGKGGVEPTVTDANLVLGRLDPDNFLGGEMRLDAEAARRAVHRHIAAPLGMASEAGIVRAATGILAIAAVVMAGSIRKVTVERGRDPRDFALFAYGGGGPLHAVELARELYIPTVVIPPEPGNFSATGMLLADVRRDAAQTLIRPLSAELPAEIEAVFADIERPLRSTLDRETSRDAAAIARFAELRYRGQVHSVEIPLAALTTAEAIRDRFEQAYAARYGHSQSSNPVELVALRSAASVGLPRPDFAALRPTLAAASEAGPTTRPVWFDGDKALASPVYRRDALRPGFAASGPALIQEYGSTTLIGPRDRLEIGSLGEIRISVAGRGGND